MWIRRLWQIAFTLAYAAVAANADCLLGSALPALGPIQGASPCLISIQGEWSVDYLISIGEHSYSLQDLQLAQSSNTITISMPPNPVGDVILSSPNCSGIIVYQYYGIRVMAILTAALLTIVAVQISLKPQSPHSGIRFVAMAVQASQSGSPE